MEVILKKIFIPIISLFLTKFALAQSVTTALWSLTADQNAVVAGNISAFAQNLRNMQVYYSSGVQRSSPSGTAGAWPGYEPLFLARHQGWLDP